MFVALNLYRKQKWAHNDIDTLGTSGSVINDI